MKYYFSNNTDFQKPILIGSEKKMLAFLKKYHTGSVGNAYSCTITDEDGDNYIETENGLELEENY